LLIVDDDIERRRRSGYRTEENGLCEQSGEVSERNFIKEEVTRKKGSRRCTSGIIKTVYRIYIYLLHADSHPSAMNAERRA
jgi:hypothetical protein